MSDDVTARAVVRAGFLLAAEPFECTEVKTRGALCGTRIEPHWHTKGAVIVASDGKAMALMHDLDAIVEGKPTTWCVPWKKKFGPEITAWTKKQRWSVARRQLWFDMVRTPTSSTVRLVEAETAAEVAAHNADTYPTVAALHGGAGLMDGRNVRDGYFVGEDGALFPDYRHLIKTILPQSDEEPYRCGWFPLPEMKRIAAFADALKTMNPALIAKGFSGKRVVLPNTTPLAMVTLRGEAPAAVVRFWQHSEAFLVVMRNQCPPDVADAPGFGLPTWFANHAPDQEAAPKPRKRAALKKAA